jgi:magnesium transporter
MWFEPFMRVAVAIAPEVRELLLQKSAQLDELLQEIHDEDLADLIKLLDDDEAMLLLEQLGTDNAADIFERREEHEQEHLVERFGTLRLAPIVSEMAPDEATDLIDALSDDIGGQLLRQIDGIDPEAAEDIRPLLEWPEDTAGGLMTPDFVSASPMRSAAEVIEAIRIQGEDAETINYIYALSEGVLVGVATLRAVLMAPPTTALGALMTEHLHTVSPDTDQEVAARILSKYDFTALPVVDPRGQMLGLITVDDVIDVLADEQTEDMQRIAAVNPVDERYFQTSFWTFVGKRAPWLAILFFGEFLTGAVMRRYDSVIQAVSSLAHYVPLLISTGGNSGSQSASLIIRGLATGDVKLEDWWRVLRREVGQGLVLGTGLALAGAARVISVGDGVGMALAIGITVVSIVLLGCTVGAMLPLLLRRAGLDPATSSQPFIATLVDVFGILLYFTIAKVILAEVIAQSSLGGAG